MVAIPLMKQLVLEGLMSAPVPRLPRISLTGIALIMCGVVLGVMSVVTLFVAEYLYLVTLYTAPLAALGVACTALALSLLTCAGGMLVMSSKRSRRRARHVPQAQAQPDIAKTVSALIDSIAEELEDPIRENPKTAVAIAGLAGFLAGDQVRP